MFEVELELAVTPLLLLNLDLEERVSIKDLGICNIKLYFFQGFYVGIYPINPIRM